MIFGVAEIDPERKAELIKLASSLGPRFYSNIFKRKQISETGAQQNVASILIFSQSFGGTLHLTDWETKGEKMKKMGLGVPALPFTFVAHLLAVAAIVMLVEFHLMHSVKLVSCEADFVESTKKIFPSLTAPLKLPRPVVFLAWNLSSLLLLELPSSSSWGYESMVKYNTYL
ncbi:hypothetical protein S245_066514, partial [Arachis hypogaea]